MSSPLRARAGWTLVELLLAVAILGALAALAIPAYADAREEARVAEAIADLRVIESEIAAYRLAARSLPASLADIGREGDRDPWGHAYRYLRFEGANWVAQARVDRFQVPINSDYDLYSIGRDGDTALSLQLPPSLDDVIRANDGSYMGLASRF